MTTLERVQALIAKALSTSSEEEARTCAITAVRTMGRERLSVIDAAETEVREKLKVAQQRQAKTAEAQRRYAARTRKAPADAPSRTSYATTCVFCNVGLPVGAKVYWSKLFKVMVCPDCFETEIVEKVRT